MELSQVETFMAVATFGGFHRAAEALHISQPAVSARIKALEESLGVSLFSRSRGGLVVSDAGRTFRPHAEELLRYAAVARQAVHQAQPASGTPLQIAAALSISVYFLPDVLQALPASPPHRHHQHPPRPFQRSSGNGAQRRSRNRPRPLLAASRG